MTRLTLFFALLAIACTPPEGRFGCTTANDCPANWVCRDDDHRCWSTPNGSTPDAGIDASTPLDANLPDMNVSVPDTNVTVPDTDVPDTNVPDTNVPDMGTDLHDVGIDANAHDAGPGVHCDDTLGAVTTSPGVTVCSPFGGMFLRNDEASGTPCDYTNPYTGACSCPDGFDPRDTSSFRTLTSGGATDVQAHLYLCLWPDAVATSGWGGVYVIDETGPCVFPNALGGGGGLTCTCGGSTTFIDEWRGISEGNHALRVQFCGLAGFVRTGAFQGAFTHRDEGGTSCPALCASGDCDPCAGREITFPGFIDPTHCAATNTLCAPPL